MNAKKNSFPLQSFLLFCKMKIEVIILNKIKVVQYGVGKMSVYSMRYVYEKGATIVGAIDVNPAVVGKDIGEIMGTAPKGVVVTPVEMAEQLLMDVKPDICIVTTQSLLSDVKDALLLCAKLGINAITTCEEAFYPWNSNPVLTKQIDELAKKNNCTITGSGYQDIYWGELISAIASSTHKITKIIGESWYNVEDYGIALANAHGAGMTLEEFDKNIASVDRMSDEERNSLIESGTYSPSYMWNVNGWLCSKLGLTITHQTQKCVPQTHKEDIVSSTLGKTIKAGEATGMSAVVTTTTKEGITIESQCVGKVYAKEETDKNVWTVSGEPDTTIVVNRPATVELTCATIVNRIPDVINAEPGFVTTDHFDELTYRVKPLEEYLK